MMFRSVQKRSQARQASIDLPTNSNNNSNNNSENNSNSSHTSHTKKNIESPYEAEKRLEEARKVTNEKDCHIKTHHHQIPGLVEALKAADNFKQTNQHPSMPNNTSEGQCYRLSSNYLTQKTDTAGENCDDNDDNEVEECTCRTCARQKRISHEK